jgi:hypothetical protein
MDMLREINKKNKSRFDFFYIPIDFESKGNKAYCFINFLHPLFILEFFKDFQNKSWLRHHSKKKVELYYGAHSNIDELKGHFCQSSIITQVDPALRPRIFKVKEMRLVEEDLKRVIKRHNVKSSLREALEWFPLRDEVLF